MIDVSKSPCGSFFDFTCGKFIKSTVIHDRYNEEGLSSLLADEEDEKIRRLLSDTEKPDFDLKAFKLAKKTFAMCMKHEKIEIDGAQPLYQVIEEEFGGWSLIGKDTSINFDWQIILEKMMEFGFPSDSFFKIYLTADPRNATKHIVKIIPPEKGDYNSGYYDLLPKRTENQLIEKYFEYMTNFTVLLGATKENAYKEMMEVLALEMDVYNAS